MSAPEIRPYDPEYPYDELTGLLKRTKSLPLIEKLIACGEEFGLILADIDRCAYLNQDYGPTAGDWAIRNIAEAIKAEAGENAILCRFAGDKFLICLPGWPAAAQEVAKKLRIAARDAPVQDYDGKQVSPPSLTFGAVYFPEHGNNLEALLAALEQAVHQGKQAGGDCVIVAGNA